MSGLCFFCSAYDAAKTACEAAASRRAEEEALLAMLQDEEEAERSRLIAIARAESAKAQRAAMASANQDQLQMKVQRHVISTSLYLWASQILQREASSMGIAGFALCCHAVHKPPLTLMAHQATLLERLFTNDPFPQVLAAMCLPIKDFCKAAPWHGNNLMHLQVKRAEMQAAQEAAYRADTSARLEEESRLEQLNAHRRRLKVAEHMHEVERLVAAKRAMFEEALVRYLLANFPPTLAIHGILQKAWEADCISKDSNVS